MNTEQAKQVLLLYRPGSSDADDPEIAEALELARTDADLGRWFDEHCGFQIALRAKFRQIQVPFGATKAILAEHKIIRPQVWWESRAWLAAAAAVVLLLGLAGLWFKPARPDRFSNFRTRMVRAAQRVPYQMDLVTNDMHELRRYLAERGAPADYDLTKGLEGLQLTGGAFLHWRNNPVSMICFDRGSNQMVFLFVMNRSALKDPPLEKPQLAKVNALQTASWTHGDKTYLLAGADEPDFPRKYQ